MTVTSGRTPVTKILQW